MYVTCEKKQNIIIFRLLVLKVLRLWSLGGEMKQWSEGIQTVGIEWVQIQMEWLWLHIRDNVEYDL